MRPSTSRQTWKCEALKLYCNKIKLQLCLHAFFQKSLKISLCIFTSFYKWRQKKSNILRKILKTIISKRLWIRRRKVSHISHTVVLETAIASTREQFPGLSVPVQEPVDEFPVPQGA